MFAYIYAWQNETVDQLKAKLNSIHQKLVHELDLQRGRLLSLMENRVVEMANSLRKMYMQPLPDFGELAKKGEACENKACAEDSVMGSLHSVAFKRP